MGPEQPCAEERLSPGVASQTTGRLMERWHLLRNGRIIRTAWSSNGDCAERELTPLAKPRDLLVSDTDWRTRDWRRALIGRTNHYTPSPTELLRMRSV